MIHNLYTLLGKHKGAFFFPIQAVFDLYKQKTKAFKGTGPLKIQVVSLKKKAFTEFCN